LRVQGCCHRRLLVSHQGAPNVSLRPPLYATLDDWIARAAIPFAVDSPETFPVAVDTLIASLGDSVELLGLGEALHGGEEILLLRNRLFERLVAAHGYSAIAIESSFPRAHAVNAYVAGRGPASYEAVQESGFSHGFGRLAANRELVEWMRRYNADPAHGVKLQFYGFDSPTEMMFSDSPRQVLQFVLDYLASIDRASGQERRQRIDPLLGQDADWENPAANFDPTKSIGLSPAAAALRIETEDLITELHIRRPELVAKSDASRSHLKYGKAQWQLGPELLIWWPTGAHLKEMFGPRYAVIGSAVGVSEANGIGPPETGTLEARLTAAPGPVRFIPPHRGQGLPTSAIDALPTRSGSTKDPTYFALTPQSVTDFDWLRALDSTTYHRGGPHAASGQDPC
jgi:hypothetical protein